LKNVGDSNGFNKTVDYDGNYNGFEKDHEKFMRE
jgi:hypothetical protein